MLRVFIAEKSGMVIPYLIVLMLIGVITIAVMPQTGEMIRCSLGDMAANVFTKIGNTGEKTNDCGGVRYKDTPDEIDGPMASPTEQSSEPTTVEYDAVTIGSAEYIIKPSNQALMPGESVDLNVYKIENGIETLYDETQGYWVTTTTGGSSAWDSSGNVMYDYDYVSIEQNGVFTLNYSDPNKDFHEVLFRTEIDGNAEIIKGIVKESPTICVPYPIDVELYNTNYNTVGVGETIDITPLLVYSDGKKEVLSNTQVEWASDDTSIASVDDIGNVTGISTGTTNIYVLYVAEDGRRIIGGDGTGEEFYVVNSTTRLDIPTLERKENNVRTIPTSTQTTDCRYMVGAVIEPNKEETLDVGDTITYTPFGYLSDGTKIEISKSQGEWLAVPTGSETDTSIVHQDGGTYLAESPTNGDYFILSYKYFADDGQEFWADGRIVDVRSNVIVTQYVYNSDPNAFTDTIEYNGQTLWKKGTPDEIPGDRQLDARQVTVEEDKLMTVLMGWGPCSVYGCGFPEEIHYSEDGYNGMLPLQDETVVGDVHNLRTNPMGDEEYETTVIGTYSGQIYRYIEQPPTYKQLYTSEPN